MRNWFSAQSINITISHT